jgi:para-nitrobenzyl esterase
VGAAAELAPQCIQPAEQGTAGSEDCLYLNVFAPSRPPRGQRLPVMVHLHPGGNTFGAPYTAADGLVAQDVIVVAVAYRLGWLGFVAHPALTAEGGGSSGEYGLFDQIAALRWVQRNIAAFGGDPGRVTLLGASAGSFDTAALVVSRLADGLFQRASIQGVPFWTLTGTFVSLPEAEQVGLELAALVGCDPGPRVIRCLRRTPADELVASAGGMDLEPIWGGAVLPRPMIELARERRTVPLLLGFDREEQSAFYGPVPDPFDDAMLRSEVERLVGPDLADAAQALYPPTSYPSRYTALMTMATDAVRGCATRRLANAVRGPVWRWLYTHVLEDDPFFAQFGASHVLEDQFIWNADVLGLGHVLTPAEQTLAAQVSRYWTNFAKTGDPNGRGLPRWPRYEQPSEPSFVLDHEFGVERRYHVAQCALLDTIPTPFP